MLLPRFTLLLPRVAVLRGQRLLLLRIALLRSGSGLLRVDRVGSDSSDLLLEVDVDARTKAQGRSSLGFPRAVQ